MKFIPSVLNIKASENLEIEEDLECEDDENKQKALAALEKAENENTS